MQAAGMLCGTRAVYTLVFLTFLIGYAHPFPLQLLPSIPGYIPVYIRHGDEPLENINPALAEAFHEGPSLSKSIRLDNIPGPTDISPEEDEALAGKSKEIYPLHVRDVDSNTSAEDKDTDKLTEKSTEAETPKLLSIYKLPDDNEKIHHAGKSSRKQSVLKLAPVTEEGKAIIGNLAVQVEKVENKDNDLTEPSSNASELPPKVVDHHDNVGTVDPIQKIEETATDQSTVPAVTLYKDLSQFFKNQEENQKEDTEKSQDAGASSATEEVVKHQRPAYVLSNVAKLPPIALPEENTGDEPAAIKEIIESRSEEKTKDLTERNDDLSMN